MCVFGFCSISPKEMKTARNLRKIGATKTDAQDKGVLFRLVLVFLLLEAGW